MFTGIVSALGEVKAVERLPRLVRLTVASAYDPAGVVYSPGRRAFFIWHWDCGAVVLPDAVMRFDYEVASSVPGPPTNLRIVPNS